MELPGEKVIIVFLTPKIEEPDIEWDLKHIYSKNQKCLDISYFMHPLSSMGAI